MACQGLIETEIGTVGGISIKYFSKQSALGFAWTWMQSWGEAWDRKPRGFWVGLQNNLEAPLLAIQSWQPRGGGEWSHLPQFMGQDILLEGTLQGPLYLRDPSSPWTLSSSNTELKSSSYKLHPTVSASQHSLRILLHLESVPRIIWREPVTLWAWNSTAHPAHLSFLKIHSTSAQWHKDKYPQWRGPQARQGEDGRGYLGTVWTI